MYKIYNEDCLLTMKNHIDEKSIDIILTSPPYNIMRRGADRGYDVYEDYNRSNNEYIEWIVEIFDNFDKILKENGVILFNMSYGSETIQTAECMILTISEILRKTDFTLGDIILWKKSSALPNNVSPNKLTRICEYIYILCRRNDFRTFLTNKQCVNVRKNGQKMYNNIFNFIESENNDERCELNKATYSSDLCCKLLNLYGKEGMTVYDPFLGTGTTLVATEKLKMNGIGSEISAKQCEYAENRLSRIINTELSDLF